MTNDHKTRVTPQVILGCIKGHYRETGAVPARSILDDLARERGEQDCQRSLNILARRNEIEFNYVTFPNGEVPSVMQTYNLTAKARPMVKPYISPEVQAARTEIAKSFNPVKPF